MIPTIGHRFPLFYSSFGHRFVTMLFIFDSNLIFGHHQVIFHLFQSSYCMIHMIDIEHWGKLNSIPAKSNVLLKILLKTQHVLIVRGFRGPKNFPQGTSQNYSSCRIPRKFEISTIYLSIRCRDQKKFLKEKLLSCYFWFFLMLSDGRIGNKNF